MNFSKRRKLGDNGSVLVAVIIIVSIVGILAGSLFIMTMSNSQMKRVDRQSKDTFYSAETALDEITLGLQDNLAKSTREAYGYLLVNYLSDNVSQEERDKKFKKTVHDNLIAVLEDQLSNPTPSQDDINTALITKLTSFLSIQDSSIVKVASLNGLEADPDYKYITFKSVEVDYSYKGYSNTIITDIKIIIPDAAFSVDLPYTSELPFGAYGIIAKDSINVDNHKSLSISGNMYSGNNGINVDSSGSIDAKSSYIITVGDIHISNTNSSSEGDVSFGIKRLGTSGAVNVWTHNILVDANNNSASGLHSKKNTDFSVTNGRVNVADDLMMNSYASRVKIDGSYFGFGSSLVNEEQSSSITINGRMANLDLSNCQSISIAGRAFIDAPDYDTSGSDMSKKFVDLPTGESISVRGNQISYLVPSKCISVKHNPITDSEYGTDGSSITFDWTACDDDGLILNNYIDASNPFFAKGYRIPNSSGTGTTLVIYYYLNIKDGLMDDFFVDYCKTYGTSKMASIFTLDGLSSSVHVNDHYEATADSNIKTAQSAVISYIFDEDTLDHSEDVVKSTDSATLSGEAGAKASEYTYYKSTLKSSEDSVLAEVLPANYKSRTAVENLINFDLINEIITLTGSDEVMNITDSESGATAKIINGDYTISGTGNKGIIIATGNVTFTDGAEFEGLVISGGPEGNTAGGEVTIGQDVKVIANENLITMILGDTNTYAIKYTDQDGKKVTKTLGDFFMDPRAGQVSYVPKEDEDNEETKTQDLADLVVYENWVKN